MSKTPSPPTTTPIFNFLRLPGSGVDREISLIVGGQSVVPASVGNGGVILLPPPVTYDYEGACRHLNLRLSWRRVPRGLVLRR